jgi:hypothetical protein
MMEMDSDSWMEGVEGGGEERRERETSRDQEELCIGRNKMDERR